MRPGLAPRWFRGGWAGCGVFVTSSELLGVIACCEGTFAAPAPTRDVSGHDPALSGSDLSTRLACFCIRLQLSLPTLVSIYVCRLFPQNPRMILGPDQVQTPRGFVSDWWLTSIDP
jgi:hypothetical protein